MESNNDQTPRAPTLAHGPPRTTMVRPPQAELHQEKERDREKEKKKKKKDKDRAKRTPAGSARGIETMFRTSYRTHIDMSALADSKANIMISINGIIVSILLASISPKIDANPWLLLPTTVLLVSCLGSLIFAVLAARPRVSHHRITLDDVRRNGANILFFGNFVSMPEDDYLQGMNELLHDSDKLYNNMMRDIYSLGSVLERKFRLLRTSYTVFMFGLIGGVTLFIAVFVGVVLAGTPAAAGSPF